MFIDTHCHINDLIRINGKSTLTLQEISRTEAVVEDAQKAGVTTLINVGTNLIESNNCVTIARKYAAIYASVGIHPNDLTDSWKSDYKIIRDMVKSAQTNKIVGIGECGIDRHYPGYNLERQYDCFKAHIELALEYNCALIVHSRDAPDETLSVLSEYKGNFSPGRVVIHCFSYDQSIANEVINMNFVIGVGGTITYPKNNVLRSILSGIDLKNVVLETDSPFLPPQSMRGQQNKPEQIYTIAQFIAQLRGDTLEHIAQKTTETALTLFNL